MKKKMEALAKPRREYDKVYRQEAVQLWKRSGKTAEQVAEELGLGALTLYRWNQEMKKTRPDPPPGVDARPAAEQLLSLQLELKRLRKENEGLVEQCIILKKATGILSQAPLSGMPRSSD